MLHFIHTLLFAVYFTVLTKEQQGSQGWRTEAPKFETSKGLRPRTLSDRDTKGLLVHSVPGTNLNSSKPFLDLLRHQAWSQ